jgi:hypothetical protein
MIQASGLNRSSKRSPNRYSNSVTSASVTGTGSGQSSVKVQLVRSCLGGLPIWIWYPRSSSSCCEAVSGPTRVEPHARPVWSSMRSDFISIRRARRTPPGRIIDPAADVGLSPSSAVDADPELGGEGGSGVPNAFSSRMAISGEIPDLAFSRLLRVCRSTPRTRAASVTPNPFFSRQSCRTVVPGCIARRSHETQHDYVYSDNRHSTIQLRLISSVTDAPLGKWRVVEG